MGEESFFLKYLGKAKWLAIRVARRLVPAFDVFCIERFAKKYGNIILRLSPRSFAEHCSLTGDKLTIIEKEQDRIVFEPAYYGKSESREHRFKSPPIYIAELSDVYVHGGTGLVIQGERALTDIFANDVDNRVDLAFGTIRRAEKERLYLETHPRAEEMDGAVNLCGLAASNYYHLTFEILSRYGYVKKYLGDRRIPVLISEGAKRFPQLQELTRTVLANAEIIYIPEYRRVHCARLIQPSMNTWMPLNVRRKKDFRISDNLIAKSAADHIRETAEAYRQEKSGRKIFISRKNATVKRVRNEAEVAELFRRNGYEIICTENLTYREQVELFSSAACIVGASGAALTNLVYCHPGTVFGCIIPEKYEFCIYSTIAHMAGCKVLFLDAKVTRPRRTMAAEQCRVDSGECEGYIKRLDEMIDMGREVWDSEGKT